MQLCADDKVLYVHAKTEQEAASVLSAAMEPLSQWFKKNNVYILTQKRQHVCVFLS